MLTTILLTNLINFVILFFFGRFLGRKGAFYLSLSSTGLATSLAINKFLTFIYSGKSETLILGRWVEGCGLSVEFSFIFDGLAQVFIIVILIISVVIFCFSDFYMEKDPYAVLFFAYLNLFTFFMVALVSSKNIVLFLACWEGVGLCSFLLISFWSTRIFATIAAIKAIMVNRVADTALILVTLFLISLTNSTDFYNLFSLKYFLCESKIFFFSLGPKELSFELYKIDFICYLLIVGVMGKSAQLFFHIWLPDAMEGPTPVSAFIHSATMVTLGLFILFRFSHFFELSKGALNFIAYVGLATMVFSSVLGCFQFDLKKIIAYSTGSQLGLMAFACGVSQYEAALFHLVNHAFFKALLFITAGVIIAHLKEIQDIRCMGGLFKFLPITFTCMFIATLSLNGFFYLSGFYSKDAIINAAAIAPFKFYNTAKVVLLFSLTLTTFYSTRVLYLVFFGDTNLNKKKTAFLKEQIRLPLKIAMLLLLTLSVVSGFLSKELFLSKGSTVLSESITTQHVNDFLYINSILSNPHSFYIAAFSSIGVPLFFYYLVLSKRIAISKATLPFAEDNPAFKFIKLCYGLYLWADVLLKKCLLVPVIRLSYRLWVDLEKGFLEAFGVLGLFSTFKKIVLTANKSNNLSLGMVVLNVVLLLVTVLLAI